MSDTKRRDIQTLRAIAVLSVVAFHAFPDLVPGGFVGVDVFFVLSGYVITRSIMSGIQRGDFTVADFYRRRIRRIFPALFIMLIATAITGWFILDPDQLSKLGRNIASASLFLSNVEFAITTGYFDGGAGTKPLLHTWSLAVEEQFYIFYPLLVVLIYRLRASWLVPSLIVLAVLSLALSEIMLSRWSSPAYYLSPPRFYELLVGASLAAWNRPIRAAKSAHSVVAVVGLLGIFVPVFLYAEATRFPGFAALAPCLGTALIIAIGPSERGWLGKIMSFRPVIAIGNWSYSIYLWHWPILVFVTLAWPTEPPVAVIVVALAATVLIGWLSNMFVEEPIGRIRLQSAPFLGFGVAAILLASIGGGSLFMLNGVPARFGPSASNALLAAGDINPMRSSCHSLEAKIIAYQVGCVFGDQTKYPEFVVWGDSHGTEISFALGESAGRGSMSVRELTYSACPPALGVDFANRPQCKVYNEQVATAIAQDSRVRGVVLVANVAAYGKDDQVVEGIATAARRLTQAGKRVAIVLPIPTMTFTPPARVATALRFGMSPNEIGRSYEDYMAENGTIRTKLIDLASDIDATVIDPAAQLCGQDFCSAYDATYGTLYFDNVHLGVSGATKALSTFNLASWSD